MEDRREACALQGFSPNTPLANVLGHGVPGTARLPDAGVPPARERCARKKMRAGRPRSQDAPSQDAAPAQAAPWGEIRQNALRTDPKPRKNAASVGVKISRPPIYTLYIKNLRAAHGTRRGQDRRHRRRAERRRTPSPEEDRRPGRHRGELCDAAFGLEGTVRRIRLPKARSELPAPAHAPTPGRRRRLENRGIGRASAAGQAGSFQGS